MTKYVIAKVGRNDWRAVVAESGWANDYQIVAQFEWSACGGEGQTQCVTLLDQERHRHVGFVGLSKSFDALGDEVAAIMSVEFVFVESKLRGSGLSKYFLDYIEGQAVRWVQTVRKKNSDSKIALQAISNPKTSEGERFVRSLGDRLKKVAKSQGVRFTS